MYVHLCVPHSVQLADIKTRLVGAQWPEPAYVCDFWPVRAVERFQELRQGFYLVEAAKRGDFVGLPLRWDSRIFDF